MGNLKIVHYPNKILRVKARPIAKLTNSNYDKIRRMFHIMYQLGGMGLAAPQIGWNARIFIMNLTGNDEDELVFVNPIIMKEGGEPWEMEEGCLSFPGITGSVVRNSHVVVKAQSLNGRSFEFTDDKLAGRCVLHEIDHLSGILLIDRATKLFKGKDPL